MSGTVIHFAAIDISKDLYCENHNNISGCCENRNIGARIHRNPQVVKKRGTKTSTNNELHIDIGIDSNIFNAKIGTPSSRPPLRTMIA